MKDFHTFDDVLDYAIHQEQSTQKFYSTLAEHNPDDHIRLFYRELVNQERLHEKKLSELKQRHYNLNAPNIEKLRNRGYLKARPAQAKMTIEEAIQYAVSEEESTKLLYAALAEMSSQAELAALFRTLADQEQAHEDFFEAEYKEFLCGS